MLLKILSNIRFLARQSIAIRGDGDEENSNFIQLFKLRGEDDPKFAKWLEKKTDKYVSADIQNELLKVMGLQVLRDIATSLHSAEFYSIMVDETTDVSNKEQAVLCFRWVLYTLLWSLVKFSMHGYYKEFQSYARGPRYYRRDN